MISFPYLYNFMITTVTTIIWTFNFISNTIIWLHDGSLSYISSKSATGLKLGGPKRQNYFFKNLL